MQKSKIASLAALMLLASSAYAGPFQVEKINGKLSIRYQDKVLVSETCPLTSEKKLEWQESEATLPDGTKVWNRWNEEREHRIRMEVALPADGNSVEISMSGEAEPYQKDIARLLDVVVPREMLQGASYEGLTTSGRVYKKESGTVGEKVADTPLAKNSWRYLAVSGKNGDFIFDFNPIGAGDHISMYGCGAIRGVWGLSDAGNAIRMRAGAGLGGCGGMTGSKIVIRSGKFASDYPMHHAMDCVPDYYGAFAPLYLLTFGAEKHGKMFTTADDQAYSADRHYGWLGSPKLVKKIASPEGAYYANMSGDNASYQFTDLLPGLYLVTVSSGNFAGSENKFTLTANGQTMVKDYTVGKQKANFFTLPLWVDNGILKLEFTGHFLVSTIGIQRLMANAEDFSCRRGFWVSDGYEPAALFRNENYRDRKNTFAAACDVVNMPVPGKEAIGPAKKLERRLEQPDPHAPELAWIYNANMEHIGGNSATLAEYKDPAILERFLEENKAKNVNSLMLSGMHSRHTYFDHLDRGVEYIRQVAAAAHRKNIKVIDHHDAILLWNLDGGFRVMADRVGETVKGRIDMLPSAQFCVSNPVFTRTYRDYLLEVVKAGADGFQCDELNFVGHGCGCSACRNEFYEATGWQLPLNELDPRLDNRDDPLWKMFLEWRKVKVGNWWVDFRREAKKINPYLTFCMYTTHYGFVSDFATLSFGFDLTEVGRAINFFGTEVMTRNCLKSFRALLPYRKMKNLLRIAYGSPVWGWLYGSTFETNYAGWAACNMTGQSALVDDLRKEGQPNYKAFEGSADNMNRSIATPVAEVAILFSNPSRDWNQQVSFSNELFGLAQTLESLHVPYDIIGNMSLDAQSLRKYKFLAICTSGCISDEDLVRIKDFAKKGGTVYLSTVAGMYNEVGTLRKEWGFADVMHFTPENSRLKLPKIGRTASPAEAVTPAAMHYLFKVTPKPGVKLSNNSPLYGFDANGKAYPLFYTTNYGRGKFVYECCTLAADFYTQEGSPGRKWEFEEDAELGKIFYPVLRELIGKAAYWQVKAPSQVNATIYKQDNALAIHFFNATGVKNVKGEEMTYEAPDPAYPALTEDVVFQMPAPAQIKEVYAVSPDFEGHKPLVWKKTANNTIIVTLPKELLKVYTLVWIK